MELLIYLVGRRDQMVSREDIVRKLWRSNLFVDTERNVNNIIRKIRTALGDSFAKPRFLETVVGKGYRFIGPVRVIDAQHPRSDLGQPSARTVRSENASERGERSSLAVLPLLLLGKATDDDGLCLGFADAMVSRLGNLQGVDVLPTSAVLNLPLEASPLNVASLLGVRFVLQGAIQVSKGQWRLSVEMLDTYLQRAIFTRKCDLDVNRLPDLESEIAKHIAGALNRPLAPVTVQQSARYSRDPMAYAEFMRTACLVEAGLLERVLRHAVLDQLRGAGGHGHELRLARALHADEPEARLVDGGADGEQSVVLVDGSLAGGERGGHLLAGLEVEDHGAALLRDHPVIAVERARILRDRIEGDAERCERLAVHAVAVRRGDHVGSSLVDGRVDHEGGAIDGPGSVDDIAVVVHQQQVADADVAEAHRERVDPEVIGELRIADGDVAGNAFAEAEAAEDAQCAGESLLAVQPLVLHVRERRRALQADSLRCQFDTVDRSNTGFCNRHASTIRRRRVGP